MLRCPFIGLSATIRNPVRLCTYLETILRVGSPESTDPDSEESPKITCIATADAEPLKSDEVASKNPVNFPLLDIFCLSEFFGESENFGKI